MWGWHQLIFALLKALIQVSIKFEWLHPDQHVKHCYAGCVTRRCQCTVWPLVPYGYLCGMPVCTIQPLVLYSHLYRMATCTVWLLVLTVWSFALTAGVGWNLGRLCASH